MAAPLVNRLFSFQALGSAQERKRCAEGGTKRREQLAMSVALAALVSFGECLSLNLSTELSLSSAKSRPCFTLNARVATNIVQLLSYFFLSAGVHFLETILLESSEFDVVACHGCRPQDPTFAAKGEKGKHRELQTWCS